MKTYEPDISESRNFEEAGTLENNFDLGTGENTQIELNKISINRMMFEIDKEKQEYGYKPITIPEREFKPD